ncbi:MULTISPECIES: hypothetical protein [unclassified Microcoleus]|uniref:hypothetical protein n=1 Tax=unclassified Microcoleus TaxID=2642155 RepID=UPI0025DF5014|nr:MULTISPECIES: hypothetical protein [unclassified Microcoleus]
MWKKWCPNNWISLSKEHRAGISWHNHLAICRSPTAMAQEPLLHWLNEAIAKT